MKLVFVLVCLSLCSLPVMGQLRHDANWCFGEGVLINFKDIENPILRPIVANNNEANASISDIDGKLLLYVSCDYTSLTSMPSIRGEDDSVISNGDSIILDFSATNGAVFLPVSEDTILLFHIGFEPGCGFIRCHRLYSTSFAKGALGQWVAIEKNRLLTNLPVEESIGLVKHSNGRDWWLFIHEEKYDHQDSCSNKNYGFLIQRSNVLGPYIQNSIGGPHCSPYSYGGEISISPTGKFLARVASGESYITIYSVDRCTGSLDSVNSINETGSYGISIIGDFIYTSSTTANGTININQYNLLSANLDSSRKLIFQVNAQGLEMGQIESLFSYGILTFFYNGPDVVLKERYQNSINAIRFADTDSAVMHHYLIDLSDSAKTSYGLPNFPNYNLGPEGVFLASAGKDTVLCSNTNPTGVPIGAPPMANVTYLWQPSADLSASNTAQPLANPAQSTWYYLTATDTTATSCAVNTDSVYVEVRTCVGIDDMPLPQAKLYPNPTTQWRGLLTIELPTDGEHTFLLYNLLGQEVLSEPLTQKITTLNLSQPWGIYLYRITASDTHWSGTAFSGKLLVE